MNYEIYADFARRIVSRDEKGVEIASHAVNMFKQ